MTVAMDAMAVAIHIKYALSLNEHFTYYCSARLLLRNINTETLEDGCCGQEDSFSTLWLSLRQALISRDLNTALHRPE